MRRHIETMSDCSERVPYNIEGFPIHADRVLLSDYAGMACATHWHDDLEFGVPLTGQMRYCVNGEPITIQEGQGVFINARQLHSNFSVDGSDCAYVCMLIHPSLLCANEYLAQTYIQPIMDNGAFTHAVLDASVPWQREMMEAVCAIRSAFAENEASLGLTLQSVSYHIAALLYKHMPDPSGASAHVDQRLAQLRDMVGYVQRHYAEPVTLQNIAVAGSASKTVCCTLFQHHLHQTPIGYLTRYRLEKAGELLRNPNLTVTEIAFAVGFSSPSYFTESFRKYLGLTPSEYRKQGSSGKTD